MQVAGITPDEIDCVAIARPFARGTESAAHLELLARFPRSEIVVVEHHFAHAASAYYVSGFSDATVLSLDRAGDFRSGVLFQAKENQLTPVRELYFPDSLGVIFNRVTDLLGFEARGDEHKVQWLATTAEAGDSSAVPRTAPSGRLRVAAGGSVLLGRRANLRRRIQRALLSAIRPGSGPAHSAPAESRDRRRVAVGHQRIRCRA